jgi:hypothetical protein
MRKEEIEIYSDEPNLAILRHPGRNFPGVLVQGDTLHWLCQMADNACARAKPTLDVEAYAELNKMRNALQGQLTHYKKVLGEHGLPLPFSG